MCVDAKLTSGAPCAGHPSGKGPCGGECAKCQKYEGNVKTPITPILAGLVVITILGR